MSFNDKIVKYHYEYILDTSRKIFRNEQAYDIANDTAIKLLELPKEKLNQLNISNGLKKYIYRMIINSKIDCYRTATFIDDIDDVQIKYDEVEMLTVDEVIHVLDEYELKLITIYSECKSVVEMSNKYNIRRQTIHEEISRIKEKINKFVKNKQL